MEYDGNGVEREARHDVKRDVKRAAQRGVKLDVKCDAKLDVKRDDAKRHVKREVKGEVKSDANRRANHETNHEMKHAVKPHAVAALSQRARRSCRALAASLCAFALASSILPARAEDAARAMPADAFVDTLAVNTHINYLDGAYANLHNVADDLAWLGIRHVREFTPGNAAPLSSYVFLAQRGIKFNLVMHQDVEASVKEAARLNAAAPGSVVALEGYNEIDHWPVTYGGLTGMAGGLASQRAAFTQVRATPALAGVAVYDLTGYDPKSLATRADSADYVNLHVYPQNGEQPTWNAEGNRWMAPAIATFRKFGLPAVITEFGYFSLPQAGWYMLGVDEATQAKGVLNGYMDAAAAGVKRTYVYELLDEKPDPQGKNNELHYGMFRIDNSPKRVAQSIRNLTAMLGANAARPVNRETKDTLAYSISGMPPSANRLLLQKKDGRFVLVLWNETPIWNREKGTPLESPPAQVQVDFGATASRVDIYDPMLSAAPLSNHRDVRSLSVAVPDHPVLIEVTLAAAPRA